ncbi:MAG TPA: citrate/2-methylcitrate synthase [Candidatus Saccharimonadia bacterium]|nr:citrate/2-methylcitrate synthase [Candidatus Saccharimonadia bacterium]
MKFQTKISREVDGELQLRGKSLNSFIQHSDYVSTLYFALTGKEISAPQLRILNAILVASIDHGVAPASSFVPRVVISNGNEVTHALASGILALGPYHGAAIEDAMRVFQKFSGKSTEEIETFVKEQRAAKKRILGFGHKIYTTEDPRTKTLFELAKNEGVDGPAMKTARAIESALEKTMGRKLVLNIDGAVAALLLEIDLPPEAGNGIFALARMGGMLAHIIEEKQQGTVVRRLDESDIEYL